MGYLRIPDRNEIQRTLIFSDALVRDVARVLKQSNRDIDGDLTKVLETGDVNPYKTGNNQRVIKSVNRKSGRTINLSERIKSESTGGGLTTTYTILSEIPDEDIPQDSLKTFVISNSREYLTKIKDITTLLGTIPGELDKVNKAIDDIAKRISSDETLTEEARKSISQKQEVYRDISSWVVRALSFITKLQTEVRNNLSQIIATYTKSVKS